MNNKIYFDHSATTPLLPEVIEEMNRFLTDCWGNPSSLYQTGQRVKAEVQAARESIAANLGADPKEIVFTGSGTEADNYAIKGVFEARRKRGNHIICFALEHPAVIEPCKYLEKRGAEITYLYPDKSGILYPEQVEEAITDRTILITVMMANNVIGAIQPLKEIAAVAKAHGITFHTDAVQTAGTLPIDVKELGVDLLAISGHKFHGPKGVGALYVRKGTRIAPLIHGGGQERGRRSGTENVPGIIGMARALEIAVGELKTKAERLKRLRDRLVKGVLDQVPDVAYVGDPKRRLPGNACFSFKYIEGESLVLHLDMMGIAASSGSACSSHTLEPSHVLLGIGMSPVEAHGSLRVTLGRSSTDAEVDYFLNTLPAIVQRLREMSPFDAEREEEYLAGGPKKKSGVKKSRV